MISDFDLLFFMCFRRKKRKKKIHVEKMLSYNFVKKFSLRIFFFIFIESSDTYVDPSLSDSEHNSFFRRNVLSKNIFHNIFAKLESQKLEMKILLNENI